MILKSVSFPLMLKYPFVIPVNQEGLKEVGIQKAVGTCHRHKANLRASPHSANGEGGRLGTGEGH